MPPAGRSSRRRAASACGRGTRNRLPGISTRPCWRTYSRAGSTRSLPRSRVSAATCLFAFRIGDGLVRMGILGDGCAAAVKHDGTVVTLSDDKAAGFSNVTSALSPGTSEASWTVLAVPETECEAVVLCTDGVFDDLEDVEDFMAGFVKAYRGLARVTASRLAREMLENWPVPKHSDDKTIACLFRAEVPDE